MMGWPEAVVHSITVISVSAAVVGFFWAVTRS